MSGALVQQVNYTPKLPSVRSRHLSINVQPSNGASFSAGGDQIILDIPTGAYGQYLCQEETYLKFKVTNNAGVNLTFDRDVSSLFSRMTLTHSSTVLEDISQYNVLNRMYQDLQIDPLTQTTSGSITRGHEESNTGATVYIGQTLATTVAGTYCMSILSGIIGPQAPKYVPIGAIGNGGNLRLTLTMDALTNGGKSGDGTANIYTISEVNLVCGIVEVDSSAQQMIEQSSGNIYAMSSTGWKNYTANAEAGVSTVEALVPAKASSMKSLFVVSRADADMNSNSEFSIGGRETGGLSEFFVTSGGVRYPAGKPIQVAGGDSFEQCQKCFNGINNINQRCDMNRTRWELTENTGNDTDIATKGAFVAGVELESYGTDGVESGLNTLGSNMFFHGTYNANVLRKQQLSFFSVFDVLVTAENGILSVKY